MARRTPEKIEADYKRIQRYIHNHPTVSSFSKVCNGVKLSRIQVMTSFKKHPRALKNVNELIAHNAQSKRDARAQKSVSKQPATPNITSKAFNEYVVDTSVVGISNLFDTLYKIIDNGDMIILTNVNIRELEKAQLHYPKQPAGIDAKRLLRMAFDNPNSFILEEIDESAKTADDCIMAYCAKRKDDVTLLTADKTMTLKARMYKVKYQFFQHLTDTTRCSSHTTPKHSYHSRGRYSPPPKSHVSTTPRPAGSCLKIETLQSAWLDNEKMYIDAYSSESRRIKVIHRCLPSYTTEDGVCELKIGDEVLIATRKKDYMTFSHFRITAISNMDNCNLLSSKRIRSEQDIAWLSTQVERKFMYEFMGDANH